MRIKFIIPFPFDDEGIATRAAQIPREILGREVINPGPVAIKMAEVFVQLGLSHSKVAFPPPSSIIDDRFFSLAGAGGVV